MPKKKYESPKLKTVPGEKSAMEHHGLLGSTTNTKYGSTLVRQDTDDKNAGWFHVFFGGRWHTFSRLKGTHPYAGGVKRQ